MIECSLDPGHAFIACLFFQTLFHVSFLLKKTIFSHFLHSLGCLSKIGWVPLFIISHNTVLLFQLTPISSLFVTFVSIEIAKIFLNYWILSSQMPWCGFPLPFLSLSVTFSIFFNWNECLDGTHWYSFRWTFKVVNDLMHLKVQLLSWNLFMIWLNIAYGCVKANCFCPKTAVL